MNFGLLNLLFRDPIAFGVVILALILSVTVHEFAHAFSADKLGDPTPRSQGRVTLNPLSHLDPIGSILLLITGFGWGRPVIFDPYNLRDLRRDVLIIAAAGPASNILIATLFAILSGFIPILNTATGLGSTVGGIIVGINITLAAFNLLPIHPLDGGKIFSSLLPRHLAYEYDAIFERYGFIILLLLVFPIFGPRSGVSYFMTPVINLISTGIYSLAQAVHSLF